MFGEVKIEDTGEKIEVLIDPDEEHYDITTFIDIRMDKVENQFNEIQSDGL